MLRRLTIENIGVIDHLEIPFEDGFTVLTGETGSGKSIIVDCIGLALGAKADATLLRAGADKARVEALFELQPEEVSFPGNVAQRLGIATQKELRSLRVVREIDNAGRSTCLVNGHRVPLKLLQETARHLAETHGQRQTLFLLRPGEQRDILDRYADLLPMRGGVADAVRQLRHARAELARLRLAEQEQAGRRDDLTHELRAIQDAAIVPGEDEALRRERSRLANAEQLGLLVGGARGKLIDSSQNESGAIDALAEAAQSLRAAAELDADLKSAWETAEAILEQAQDLSRSLGRYAEIVETNPDRLDAVEERIAVLDDLKRRHGGTIEAVIERGDQIATELAALESTPRNLAALTAEETGLNADLLEQAASLSAERSYAAARLGRALESEIVALALEGARVIVQVMSKPDSPRDEPVDALSICDESGSDYVEILIAPNEGEPPRPLTKSASGGEMARIALALKTILTHSDTRSLMIDEIDVGVGGHVGGTIGGKLAGLARRQQVICVTHLPQVAAHASNHIRVFKQTEHGRTTTGFEDLSERSQRTAELAKMIGSQTIAGRQSMAELLDEADGRRADAENAVPLRLLEAVG